MSTCEVSNDEQVAFLSVFYGDDVHFYIPSKFQWGVSGNETQVAGPCWTPNSGLKKTANHAKYALFFEGPAETKDQFRAFVEEILHEFMDNPNCLVIIC